MSGGKPIGMDEKALGANHSESDTGRSDCRCQIGKTSGLRIGPVIDGIFSARPLFV